MTETDKFLVLMSMNEVSNKKQEDILNNFEINSIDTLLFGKEIEAFLSKDELERIRASYDRAQLDGMIENMLNSGITILTVLSDEYPQKLIDLPDRPLILYCKGDLSLLDMKGVAMVGTRMPTNYGRMTTEKFAKALAESGLVIISGMCYGIDEIAHRGTLDVGGKTIAVVGSGFGHIYPSSNTELSKEIASKGLLMSEYPPSFQPKRYTFPHRNRIVAGLSDGVLITEAGFKSGTVHTKEFALEYGKDLFAIPGNINNPKSELPNHIIKTAQAECVTAPSDIIEFYGLQAQAKKNKVVSLNFDEQLILKTLENGEQDFDFISKNTKIPVNILNSCLTTLEIRGLIRKLPAQTYALI